MPQQGERRRHLHRGAHALQRPERHERAQTRRDAAEAGGQGEQDEPPDERPPVAHAIAQGARGEQQAREQERVPVHHPLHSGDARAEAPRHVGQGDVDDGRVQHGHEVAEADGEEDARVAGEGANPLCRCSQSRGQASS